MNILSSVFCDDSEFTAAVAAAQKNSPIMITGVCSNAYAPFCCGVLEKSGEKLLITVPEEKDAYCISRQMTELGANVLIWPARDCVLDNIRTVSRDWEQQRLSVLRRIIDGEYDAIISVPNALMQYTVPSDVMIESTVSLSHHTVCDLEALCGKLVSLGYSSGQQVEGKGQFSMRGGILDVFSPNYDNPIRIDFFGDEIETLTFFDVLDQRSFEKCGSVDIVPATELIISTQAKERIAAAADRLASKTTDAKLRTQLMSDAENVKENVRFASLDKYFSCIYPKHESLFDYMPSALRIVIDVKRVADRAKAYSWELSQAIAHVCSSGAAAYENADLSMNDTVLLACLEKRMIALELFVMSEKVLQFKANFSVSVKTLPAFTAENEVLSDDIASYVSGGYKTLVACSTKHSASSVKELLAAKNIKCLPYVDVLDSGAVYTTTKITGQPGGFEFAKERFAFFCEGNTEQSKKLVRRRRAYSGGSDREKIASYADLSPGDLVVHENHGIGRYDGIKKLTVEGITKDYIKIQYDGTDVLYVPCNSLDLVSKYIGAGTGIKKLSKLGGTDWYKAKQRAKNSAKSIARELIAVYSERMKQSGFAFSHDDDLQSEFESHFEYAETYGQLKASEEIKHDMERSVPMDRLLCGDVGFGKTEVALRAAFKCIEDGKQAAILVPTTILAYQHFQTLLSRFRSFPVKCEMVSRFRTKQQQDEILRRLRRGDIDIIVGTHRLLQKDVVFKDLGLLIVDEEQRFGVTHKEKLKQLAVNVDVLTLTATPIPRTLNMALSGIRDMSVLEEAPQDRVPVQTYVLEYDDLIINEAIRKELRRGGQVFFLHNNIDTIYSRASVLQKEFPDANIAVGHGKLTREQLSEIWESLVRGDTDIFVCTTIIETGIDIANANTLIIEDADRFGLSQLHQIRGRVGRSARKAYAYLTFKQDKEITEAAQKRLEALSEFTEFGSGFKIAMRDLELRGAGDLLGAQQHGNIESVGYDLFVRILEEQVSEEKGEKKQATRDCRIDVAVDAYIPESYIEASQQRIDIYRKIALLSNEEECIDLQTELIDRYGSVPISVMNLMEISMIRNMACSLGMNKISGQSNGIYFWLASIDMQVCSALAAKAEMRGKLLLSAGSKPYLYYKIPADEKMLPAIERVLQLYTEISQKQYGQNNPESV